MTTPVLVLFTPTYRPAGGVVKLMDYACHALSGGWHIEVRSDAPFDPSSKLFQIERFEALPRDERVTFVHGLAGDVASGDLILMSLPTHYEAAVESLPAGAYPGRIIHMVQGVRNVNPKWLGGLGIRTISKPASRVFVNEIVQEVCHPHLDPRIESVVINAGFDKEYFSAERVDEGDRPLRVGYFTWKSDIGDRVRDLLAGSSEFEFRSIRDVASWSELRDLYHWCDIFLGAPGPEEGLYLPGLEAMASGSLVVMPDVGGNMAYCRDGENCILVELESEEGYLHALLEFASMKASMREKYRAGGYQIAAEFDLNRERSDVVAFLAKVTGIAREFESEV